MIKLKIFGEEGFIKKLLKKNDKSPQQLYEYAQKLWSDNNIVDGCSAMQMAAQLGHAEAAYTMTCLIKQENFPGTSEDIVNYLTTAANQNHMHALNDLGNCYRQGIGVEKDVFKAIALYERAYKLGDEMAAFNIAQTKMLEMDLKENSKEGMEQMIALARKGNQQAIEFLDYMRSRGLKIPEKVYKPQADKEVDHAPECQIIDSHIAKLYADAKMGKQEAMEELMELCGNQFNRQAMNALRKLGRIKEDMSRNFKDGCANFMYDAWVALDVEPLRVLASWTYPSFEYGEYTKRDGKWYAIFEASQESDFIKRLSSEMKRCKLSGIKPKVQLLANARTGDRCVEVAIDKKNISTFYFKFDNDHYTGINRVYSIINMTTQELIDC